MEILPRLIKVLTKLYRGTPDCTYDDSETATNVISSLNSVNSVITKIANEHREKNGIFCSIRTSNGSQTKKISFQKLP